MGFGFGWMDSSVERGKVAVRSRCLVAGEAIVRIQEQATVR